MNARLHIPVPAPVFPLSPRTIGASDDIVGALVTLDCLWSAGSRLLYRFRPRRSCFRLLFFEAQEQLLNELKSCVRRGRMMSAL